MSDTQVGAIVLAAGQSTRLGQPKQLIRVSGRPLLERTLDVVRASSVEPRILVLGAHADVIRADVDTRTFRVVHNPHFAEGQATSLQSGLTALPDDVSGAIVMLGDQPLVPSWLLDDLASVFDPTRHAAVRPRYADGPGNPVLLSRTIVPELLELSGDVGARDILSRHRDQILELDYSGTRAPRDVDTPADVDAFLQEWSASGAPDVPRYCQRCASEVTFREVHARYRPVCPSCGFTYFYDPKIAAVVIVEIDGRIVIQKRRYEPAMGLWTFPGGFVDRGESIHDAAVREVAEEVGLRVGDLDLIGIYSELGETVVLTAWAAVAHGQQPQAGDESSEVRLIDPDDVPDLAFHRDALVLRDWQRSRR